MEVASIDHDLGIDFNDLLSSIHQVPATGFKPGPPGFEPEPTTGFEPEPTTGFEPGPDQTQLQHAKNLTEATASSGIDQSFNQILSEVDDIFGGQLGASIADPNLYGNNLAPPFGNIFFVKLKHSEKAPKFEKKSPTCFDITG